MNLASPIDFAAIIEPVARKLLGEPNKKLSGNGELRFGTRGSMSIDRKKGTFFDHEANQGGGCLDLIRLKTGTSDAMAWLQREGFANGAGAASPKEQKRIVATYPYVDEQGQLLFEVVRFEPKDFRQRRPDGKGGWIWKLDDARRVPYRLPSLIEAAAENYITCIVEGEKDADNLHALKIPTTTNPGGVGKWRDEYNVHFKDVDTVIISDNDDVGRKHAQEVARSLYGTASYLRILDLAKAWPGCPPKGDISDWIAAGGTAAQFWDMVERAPEWEPQRTNDSAGPSGGQTLISRRAADIAPENINFLWPGRLARGKHTALAGEPGDGKSQLSIYVAATISVGGEWPCGEGRAPIGNVIIFNAEDGAADTIVPRLMAAGADLSRVHIVSAVRREDGKGRRTFNLQADLELLAKKIAEIGDVALVIIDPISSYMGKTDSHKNSEVRGALEPASEMAERMKVAILSITHFSKSGAGNTTKALHRFIGSIAFVGAPRAAFAVIEDADNEGRMLFLHAKNNMGPKPQGLAYRLLQTFVGNGIVTSYVQWDPAPVTISANEALGAAESNPESRSARQEAEDFLRELLADGPVPHKEIKDAAEGMGLAWATVRRAKDQLGVDVKRETEGAFATGAGRWVWSLKVLNSPLRCPSQEVSTLSKNEHLKDEGDGQ